MGRLRDGYESPLFQSISEEVVDLFGTEGVLYRALLGDNSPHLDPLYNEPLDTIRYRAYPVKLMYLDYTQQFISSERGGSDEYLNKIYISVNHLNGSAVPKQDKEFIGPGDIVEVHHRGEKIIYDILQIARSGWINDTDIFTGYDLDVKRSTRYAPERKQIPLVI